MHKANRLRSWLHPMLLISFASGGTLCYSGPSLAEETAAYQSTATVENVTTETAATETASTTTNRKPKKASQKSAHPKEKQVPLASAYGLTKALALLRKELGGNWVQSNLLQGEALNLEAKLKPELPALPKNIIDGVASGHANVLNDFLERHGFSIRMRPMNKGEVGVVTTTELQGKWNGQEIGELEYADGKSYPTFQIDVTAYNVPGHVLPVLEIFRRDNIKVFVTINEDELPGLQAPQLAAKLTPTRTARIDKMIHTAALPKVDKRVSAVIDWLLGMSNNKGDHIMQALAQTMLQMNQNGFRAKEAVALSGAKSLSYGQMNYYHVDRPFLLWATKDGLSYPLFATRVDYDSFKDPGNFMSRN